MGCKGPEANYNCPTVRWNDGTSWPVEAGHNCIACASPNFWAKQSPFYGRLPNVPGFGADTTAETIGLVAVGAVTAGSLAHGAGKTVDALVSRRAAGKGGHGVGRPDDTGPRPAESPLAGGLGRAAGEFEAGPRAPGGEHAEDQD
jgi:hypothetical protein